MQFENVKQYPIERDVLRELLKNIFGDDYDLLFDAFDEYINGTENFIFSYLDEEVLIFNLKYGKWVNWYKRYNVGRCLTSNMENKEEFNLFFKLLYKELKEEKL